MTCILILLQVLGVQSSCSKISWKILSDFFFHHVTAIFELCSTYSTAVTCFTSLEAVDGILDLILSELWDGFELSRHLFLQSFCCAISLKICLFHSLVSLSHLLMSSALIPLLSPDLPRVRRLMASCISSRCELKIFSSLHLDQLVFLRSSIHQLQPLSSFCHHCRRHTNYCRSHQTRQQCLVLML